MGEVTTVDGVKEVAETGSCNALEVRVLSLFSSLNVIAMMSIKVVKPNLLSRRIIYSPFRQLYVINSVTIIDLEFCLL